jgi:hypothetical protein
VTTETAGTEPQSSLKLTAIPSALWRTGAYFAPAHRRRLARRHGDFGIPVPRPSVLAAVSVLADEIVLAGFKVTRDPPTSAMWQQITTEVEESIELFEERGWTTDPRSYHREPSTPSDMHAVKVRRWENLGLPWEQLRWTSDWQPHHDEPGARRWVSYERNQRGSAWLLRHRDDKPRHWAVLVHGTEQGRLLVDQRVFRARWLFEELGCNVVLPLLPMHASRRPHQPSSGFPTLDVMDNIHGLAHCAYDIRCLLEWVAEQGGCGTSLTGLSLGGGVAALVAGLGEPLDAVVGLVPAVDFPEVFRRQTPHLMRREDAFVQLDTASRRLHEVVSPMSFVPATPPDQLIVLAGLNDRLLDPLAQAGRLADHWQTDNVHWVDQGHVTHMGTSTLAECLRTAVTTPHPE